MRTAPLVATAAALLAASLGAAPATAQPTDPPPPARQIVSRPPAPMTTKDFLQAATGSDQLEITEAEDAVVQSQNPQVQAFAHQMIHDHQADAQALRQAAESAGLPPPTMSLAGDQSKMLAGLQGQRGADFDKDYANQQVLAHTEALVVVRGYADGGANATIRQAAQTAVPMIEHHLEMARQLKASLGGS